MKVETKYIFNFKNIFSIYLKYALDRIFLFMYLFIWLVTCLLFLMKKFCTEKKIGVGFTLKEISLRSC